jgi:hypothetical protein
MPPPARIAFIHTFDHVFEVWASMAAPGGALKIHQQTANTLRKWVGRYRAAVLKPQWTINTIGDFEPDKNRLQRAVDELAQSVMRVSPS